MSELSRRDLLRAIALSVTAAGGLHLADAQHVHQVLADEKSAGPYTPKAFNDHEYRTLQTLAELIMPDANKAGASEFIDLLSSQNPKLAAVYMGGLAWIDREMQHRYLVDFVSAKPEQQTALLDLIAYRKNESPELGAGIHFFDWTRDMVVDAYYTSPIGVKDIGFLGNTAVGKFEIPAEAIDYALKRSPV
jgi:gluconate 2-dehydrogenase gamma chain